MTTAAESRPVKPRKPKACKTCKAEFVPRTSLHVLCGRIECALSMADAKQAKHARAAEKAMRVEVRARKERIKTRRDFLADAQREFNRYVRVRDAGKPCICCGRPLGDGAVGGAYDCGHYRSVGSAPHLRFHPDNAHAQNKQCNRWGAGRAVDYRLGLIARIGLDAVEALEADQAPRHYSIDDLKQIKAEYARKRRELERENK